MSKLPDSLASELLGALIHVLGPFTPTTKSAQIIICKGSNPCVPVTSEVCGRFTLQAAQTCETLVNVVVQKANALLQAQLDRLG